MTTEASPSPGPGHEPRPDAATRRTFFSRPAFWVGASALAAVAVVFALRFFPAAFPVVGLELAMDRESALQEAWSLVEEHGWVPEDYRQAASFREPNREARTYLELELGVEDAFAHLVEEADYHPYQWQVRHFRQGERTEVRVFFAPNGAPYGFTLELPEEEPGAVLPADDARELAEAGVGAWGVELDRYDLVESSQEARSGGRMDHTFVYRLQDVALGDAEARLRLRVSGDRPSEVRRLVRVPEEFSRSWEELRSTNETVALAASLVFLLLFGLAGCGGGIFYLIRQNDLIWRPALAWGLVVGGLAGLSVLSGLPLAWMGYDTAVSEGLFLTQQWVAAVGIFLGGGLMLAIIFAAAEGLTRRAMPTEPRLWRLWSPGVANTPSVLGRTLGGYLLAAVEVGFVVAFYTFAMRREGWWVPSDTLVQPDLVATYLPALTAISGSLMAGFWEEALFRAVPLAAAILIGRRFGWKGILVGFALVLQALVFAAAHADYPQQPSYARVLELVVPAALWGLVYLRFGLLPVILAHALYNLTWFSIAIFAAPAGLWLDRSLVVAAAVLPLAVVLHRTWRHGLAEEVIPAGLNRGSEPDGTRGHDPPGEPTAEGEPEVADTGPVDTMTPVTARRIRGAVAAAGVVGGILWFALIPFEPDAPILAVDREGAVEAAQDRLSEEGVVLDEPWRPLPRVQGAPGPSHRFVWQEGGEAAYATLLAEGHLRGPSWLVRFVRFTGTVSERAEEFRIVVGPDGEIHRRQHLLPEDRPGPQLDEETARTLVLGEVERVFGLDPAQLTEVAAEASSEPDRVDWTFTFSRPDVHPMETGEARVEVTLAGDRPADGVRFIHVPEEWQREQRARSTRATLRGMVSGLMLVTLLGGAAVVGLIRWARGRGGFSTRAFWGVGSVVLAASAASEWLRWPVTVAGFGTAQPFRDQVFLELGIMAMWVPVTALAAGLAAGVVHGTRQAGFGPSRGGEGSRAQAPRTTSDHVWGRWAIVGWGILLGMAAAGAAAVGQGGVSRLQPMWFNASPAAFRWPWLGTAPDAITGLIFQGVLVLLVVLVLRRLTRGWKLERARGVGVAVVGGLALAGGLAGSGTVTWILAAVAGATGLAVLVPATRAVNLAAVPIMVAVPAVLPSLRDAVTGAYPGAPAGGLVTALAVMAGAVAWGLLIMEGGRAAARTDPEG